MALQPPNMALPFFLVNCALRILLDRVTVPFLSCDALAVPGWRSCGNGTVVPDAAWQIPVSATASSIIERKEMVRLIDFIPMIVN